MDEEERKEATYRSHRVEGVAGDDDVHRRSGAAQNHAPTQRKRQHGVRHEDDEEHVPDEVLLVRESDAVADEA